MMLFLLACSGPVEVETLPTGEPGTYALSFEHDEVTRESIVHVPESYAAGAPLLLNFHGYGGTGLQQMRWADFRELSASSGFLVAYPTGTGLDDGTHWNAALDGPDNKSEADDLGYVRRLVETIAASYAIDPERVYAVGYSNGGMMSFALACHAGDLIAAVGAVSGTMLQDDESCTPAHPTAVISFHGTDDGVLPYAGGTEFRGAVEVAEWWASFNQATLDDTRTDGDIAFTGWTGGTDGTSVAHYAVDGGEHVWFDEDFEGVPTNTVLWDFLSGYDINGAR